MKDALDETLVLSARCGSSLSRNICFSLMYRVINDLIQYVVSNIGALYKASESVALLDMLWSFAHVSIGAFPRQFYVDKS